MIKRRFAPGTAPTINACAIHAASRSAQGFSLIELMVAVTIALVMSLAIFSTLASSEGRKRTLTAGNDIVQVSNFVTYQIDKLVRSAGSGFSQSAASTYGCLLKANLTSAGVILPFSGTTMGAPFESVRSALGGRFRLAPILISKDATTATVSGARSDALVIMAGSAGFGEVPTLMTTVPTATQLNLQNTVSFNPNDLVLVNDQYSGTGPADCMVEQVGPTFAGGGTATSLPLASPTSGGYYANPIDGNNLTGYSTISSALNLGSGTTANPPSFTIVGVGKDNTLYQYDLLQMGTYNTSVPIADGVFELHALYGVDTTGSGIVDTWVDPGAAGYDIATLANGTTAASAAIKKIKAVRIGMILRTSLPEKVAATTAPIKLFQDLGATLTYTRTLTGVEQNYRYQAVDFTIPLRNVLLLN